MPRWSPLVPLLALACAHGFPRPAGAPDAALGDLAGTRLVVGAPTHGLPFRLRLPASADHAHPARLIIWLHPTGTSANAWVETLAPDFAARGFAVLLPTNDASGGWTGPEANALMTSTLEAASHVDGVDATRPVLMGFSAGAQLALLLWKQTPQRFGGIAISSAGPFDLRGGEYVPMPLSPDVRGSVLLVLIGDRDGSADAWDERRSDFDRAGVRSELHRFAGAGHQFLFVGEGRDALLHWLETLR